MSKLLALAAVPVVAGLVVWNLSLTSDLSDLRAQLDGRPDAPGVTPPKPEGTKSTGGAEPRPRETGRANPQMTELVDRVAVLEKRLVEASAARAPDDGVPDGEGAPSAGSYESEEFKRAVDRVLDERDLALKRAQLEKRAEGMTRIWLHSANVGPEQTKQVVQVVFASLEKQQQIRDDETLSDEQRRADYAVVDQTRHDQIAAILDAQQMEIVGPRLVQRTRLPMPMNGEPPASQPNVPKRRVGVMRPGRPQPAEEKKDE